MSLVLCVLLGGCGRIAFDPLRGVDGSIPDGGLDGEVLEGGADGGLDGGMLEGGAMDGGTADATEARRDGSVALDAGDGGRRCEPPTVPLPPPPASAFGAPVAVAELNSDFGEDDPTLTADLREIYFQSSRGGTGELWRSVRTSVTDPWPTPERVPELIGVPVNTPELSRDGLTLYFTGTGPAGDADLFVTTRSDRSSPWSTPVRVEALSSSAGETGAVPFLDGFGIVFFSDRNGGGDLFLAFRDAADTACTSFSEPFPVPGMVNGTGFQANPWMRNDGLWLVWAGDPATGMGGGDIWVASRARLGDPFGSPAELAEIGSAANDDDPWMNDEMTVIYFGSPRTGDGEIYRATR